jgi:hypothetical protein
MQLMQRVSHYALMTIAAIVLAACSGQKEPAGRLVGDIEATVIAASGEAAKYVPDQLADVRAKLASLKAAYDKQNYADVVANGPGVLTAAQDLATAAASEKDVILKALADEWARLADAFPADVAAIQNRIELLSRKSSRKLAAGMDVEAAKSGAADAQSLWSKAQAAFAAGNLDEAVNTAKAVQAKLAAVAASLKLELPPAATPPAAA